MNPYYQAVAMYQAVGESDEDLRMDMAWHAINGYIYASPDGFAMCRPVCSTDDPETILTYDRDLELTNTPDMWHIHIVIGDISNLLSLMPYQLPFISFERKGKLKQYRYGRFLHHAHARVS